MVDTMKDIIRQAAFEAVGSPEDFDLQHFINTYPAQVALLVLQFRWTFEVEQALYNYKPQGTKSKRFAGRRMDIFLIFGLQWVTILHACMHRLCDVCSHIVFLMLGVLWVTIFACMTSDM